MAPLPFSIEEYRERQSRFLSQIPTSSLVIFPTNAIAVRSNDVSYPYRASSYMLYLCGWEYPDAVFMASHKSGHWHTTLFVQPRDTKSEIWEGRRVGPDGAAAGWPVDSAVSLESLEEEILSNSRSIKELFSFSGQNSELDLLIDRLLSTTDVNELSDPRPILDNQRVIKSSKEIELLKESAEIASAALIGAMSSSNPGIGEWQIQASIEGHFLNNKSQWSYPSIVGGGENATILHYKNNDCVVEGGDLVLVDAGCETHGYASDITRTWPINGKFNDAQREIYELVLDAQIAGIEACVAGAPWLSMHQATSDVLAQGMINLGILDCTLADALGSEFDGPYRNYFMHGTGHLLGLDVHDVGGGREGDDVPGPELQSGMVLTVEPGIYFASWRDDISIPSRYAGIGIRIEDNILITDDGPVVLSASCPKRIDEIEQIVRSSGD